MATKKKPVPRAAEAAEALAPKGGVAKAGLAAQEAGCVHSVSGKASAANAVSASLPVNAIEVTKGFNPRTSMPDNEINDLAENVKRNGLLQAVVVRPKAGEPGRFTLVCGERRLTAVKRLGWDNIPATIRLDLEGDESKALAVAVAENSDDLGISLNYIEIGRVCQRFVDEHDWKAEKIAAETGVNVAKVRRALALMEAPDDIQRDVAAGKMSMLSGVELAKMDPDIRKKVRAQIQANTSAEEIKRLAKAAAKKDGEKAEAGTRVQQAKGKKKAVAKVTWRGSREKQAAIAELAYYVHNATKKEEGTEEWCEILGMLAFALWDRGDREAKMLPSRDTKDKAERKVLADFAETVEAEAKNFTPPEEPEAEEGDKGDK